MGSDDRNLAAASEGDLDWRESGPPESVGPDPEAWRSAVAGLEADFVLVGHTHMIV